MRFAITIICLVFGGLLLSPAVEAQTEINVSAESAVLIDQTSGRVLYEKNAHNQSLIASITKIMTAIVAIESGELDSQVSISDNAIGTEGSSIYLRSEDQFTLEELIYGLMLRSGNDAAVAISEHVGGSLEGFVHLMNEKAHWIGMTNTHFSNPHGLDSEDHYSTAYDMGLLMKYAMENDTFQKISGAKSFRANDRDYSWQNKNKLLTRYYEYCTGGKTGFTKAAGRTLVTTAQKDGQTLIVVTLNAPDDWQDHIRLYEWGFEHYPLEEIQSEGEYSYENKKDEGLTNGWISDDVLYPLTDSEIKNLSSKVFLTTEALAFDQIGKKIFYLDGGEKIAETAIYQEEVNEEKSGFWQATLDTFQTLLGEKQ